jgi:alpha-tubulin suppressor-like RCC1 family protein
MSIVMRLSRLTGFCAIVTACSETPTQPEPEEPVLAQFVSLSAGGDHTCAIRNDNRMYCWGSARGGRLGDGRLDSGASLVPTLVAGAPRFHRVSAGYLHSCALEVGGTAWCWGLAENGQIANRSSVPQPRPFRIQEVPFTFLDIAAGERHSCAIASDGKPYCWGWNVYGQIGNVSTVDQGIPVPVETTLPFNRIAAGRHHTCGVSRSGQALCWGRGDLGQLGNGSSDLRRTTPAVVAGSVTWSLISAGGTHTCGLASSGEAYCWGDGSAGQLGTGSLSGSLVPAKVATDVRFRSISAGDEHTCAIATDGRALCWGHNNYGRVGIESLPAPVPTPAVVPTSVLFSDVSAGRLHTCALAQDGGVFCWGYGGFGQLGSGALFERSRPERIAEPSDTTAGTPTL